MPRLHRYLAVFLLLIATQAAADPAPADPSLDIAYAELQPLATRSLLLDITHMGDRYVAVGERGHVVYSDDGENWHQADTVPTRSTLTTVFGIGDRLWAGGHDAVIITSGDHGRTWSRQNFDPDRQQAVMDLYFTDEQTGVAIGTYGLYLVTRDGGRSWEEAVVDPDNQYHLNAMVRFADGRRMIAGEAGYSYRSFDDGETWEALALPYAGSMWGAIITAKDCVVFFGLRGHAMESCDFGDSWAGLETGTESSLLGATDEDGVLVLVGNSGTVLTRASGLIRQFKHPSGVDLAAVVPYRGGHVLLVGEEGVHLFPESHGGGDGH